MQLNNKFEARAAKLIGTEDHAAVTVVATELAQMAQEAEAQKEDFRKRLDACKERIRLAQDKEERSAAILLKNDELQKSLEQACSDNSAWVEENKRLTGEVRRLQGNWDASENAARHEKERNQPLEARPCRYAREKANAEGALASALDRMEEAERFAAQSQAREVALRHEETRLRHELEQARRQKCVHEFTCVFCKNYKYSGNATHEEAKAHVSKCEAHPMRQLERGMERLHNLNDSLARDAVNMKARIEHEEQRYRRADGQRLEGEAYVHKLHGKLAEAERRAEQSICGHVLEELRCARRYIRTLEAPLFLFGFVEIALAKHAFESARKKSIPCLVKAAK